VDLHIYSLKLELLWEFQRNEARKALMRSCSTFCKIIFFVNAQFYQMRAISFRIDNIHRNLRALLSW